jgi:RNA polymerase sigma-70 factor (ECF subfamily)
VVVTLALDEQTDLPAEADDPEDYLAEAETTEVLIKALAQLSADHQQVLVLRFINGLNHADTSRVLGRSEEAVRVLQHRALKALRTILMRHAVPERDVP